MGAGGLSISKKRGDMLPSWLGSVFSSLLRHVGLGLRVGLCPALSLPPFALKAFVHTLAYR